MKNTTIRFVPDKPIGQQPGNRKKKPVLPKWMMKVIAAGAIQIAVKMGLMDKRERAAALKEVKRVIDRTG